MPNKYGNISEIAQYNRENGTNFYTMEQVEKHKRKNSAEEFEKKHPFLASLSKSAQEARDARIGAIGAEQVRDLYNKGENELASELNNKYLGANASGILSAPMAGEFVTYGPLVGALRLGAGTAGSAAGSYIAGKAGDFADKKLGTNWIGDTGRLLGGFAGFGAGMKSTTPLIRSAATKGLTLNMPQNTFMKVRGEGFDRAFNKVNPQSFPLENKTIAIPLKQTRIVSEGTYPLYTGPKHSVTEVVNPDGTVNPRAALRIEREVADNIPGAYRMESRLENPEWHVNDPNTWAHTRNVAQSAWTVPTPKGLTKQDQMVAALGHDFGKIVSGDGHAQSSAALIEQIFPDVTEQQLTAISEHMGTPKSILGKVTKQADILNGKPAITRFVGDNGKIRLRLPSHTAKKPRELVLDPQGNNKFRVHTRTWDGDHIPAEMSGEDKNTLFNALYEELPEGAEILFPESGPGNYATRGTVAGLRRLGRDNRFTPTEKGVLQYIDKDGSVKTFEGTGFRKNPEVLQSLTNDDLSQLRQHIVQMRIPANRRFYSKPDLEYAGIPKAERNNKFRTMNFRLTQAEKDAQKLWMDKRDIYGRWKAVGEKRGLEFNEYGEPMVPIYTSDTADPSIIQQSAVVRAYKNKFGTSFVPESELPFSPTEEQQGWIDYFKSPAYRARVAKNSGLKTDKEIDEFINSLINNIKSVKHSYEALPEVIEKNVMVYNGNTGDFTSVPVLVQGSEGGHYSPATHSALTRNARGKRAKTTFTHEDLHASLKPETKARDVIEKSGLINPILVDESRNPLPGKMIKVGEKYIYSNGLEEIEPMSLDGLKRHRFNNYVAGNDEARVRGLKILRTLDEEGLPVTEDNVTTKIWNMDDYDVSQLGAFTPKSRTNYLDKLFVLPLIGLGGASILSKQKQGGILKAQKGKSLMR